ncbi:helix-turn-helix domain-containing protein [Halococcus agarilyticus]|uniref:helix-turn-helix domain-containing protein n=1 Tax=Halococcus agarilyticus TaxID=1232219 RepID=UPI00067771FC|nr:helix-turn-helix domain-containing protein [Halococcus agarilyticus]
MSERTDSAGAPTPRTPSTSTDASTAQFVLPAKGFALADLFERVPDARVECEAAIANPDDHALLVVRTEERERAVDAALRSDSGVAAVERFGERADGWTYRVTWDGRPRRLIQRLVAADVTLLSMRGAGGEWKLRLLAPDRDGIARAHDAMDDLDCGDECRRISTFDGGGSARSELTDEQREALLTAFEAGYYEIPRDITAADLADDLDISHQALSERFRRAHERLVETELVVGDRPP